MQVSPVAENAVENNVNVLQQRLSVIAGTLMANQYSCRRRYKFAKPYRNLFPGGVCLIAQVPLLGGGMR